MQIQKKLKQLGMLLLAMVIFSQNVVLAKAGSTQQASAGIAATLDISSDTILTAKSSQKTSESTETQSSSDLVMANVTKAVNVRSEASEDSEKMGLLYKDCGGRILKREDGWTKLRTGDLVGWVKDDYLLFDEEAEELAEDVGSSVIVVTSDALRVREEASTSADTLGVLTEGDKLEIIGDEENGWIEVDYDDQNGFVQAAYVDTDFIIDSGETQATIKAREEAEKAAAAKAAAENAKVTRANLGALAATEDETRLLAALIQCEAGNQPYDGKVAVGAVVMNRVKSGGYPNTVAGVIYASGQFTPALNGKVESVYNGNVSESCLQAAAEAIAGVSTVGSATHFRRAGNRDGIVIGNHVFW